MSSERQVPEPPHDPVDLLAWLYDQLDPALFSSPWDLRELLYGHQSFIAAASEVEQAALTGLDTDEAARRLSSEDAREWLPLAFLIGLDRALARANPFSSTGDPGALAAVEIRYRRTGVMNTLTLEGGAVLPACVDPGRPEQRPESPADLLLNVVRVPANEWSSARQVLMRARHDFDRDELDGGLVVACVPMIDRLEELHCVRVPSNVGTPDYSIEPRDSDALNARAAEILRRLDASGAHLAVLPELTATEALVSEWQRLVRASRPSGTRLRWVLIGTAHVTPGKPPPYNRGFLLSRRDGTVIVEQDKRFGFTLTSDQLETWGLTEALGSEELGEYIRLGDRLAFVESTLGRFVVLICEDLGRVFDVGPTVRAFGSSHVFAPVFSKPTIEFYWEHQRAREYVAAAGATTIVANSLAIARAMGKQQKIGSALLVSGEGDAKIGRATHPDDVLLFTVTATGEIEVRPPFRG
jgi:predicted amidohydrolase